MKKLTFIICMIFILSMSASALAKGPDEQDIPDEISDKLDILHELTDKCIDVKYEIFGMTTDSKNLFIDLRLAFLEFRKNLVPEADTERQAFLEAKTQYLEALKIIVQNIRDAANAKDHELLKELREEKDNLRNTFNETKENFKLKKEDFKQQLEEAATDIKALRSKIIENKEEIAPLKEELKAVNLSLRELAPQIKEALKAEDYESAGLLLDEAIELKTEKLNLLTQIKDIIVAE